MFSLFTFILAVQVAQAAPLFTRQALTPDLTVVKFAALAELLESTFYTQALEKFTAQDLEGAGYTDGLLLIDQLTVIRDDEQTHLTTLQSVVTTLGGSTSDLDSCQFNFGPTLSDVTSFLNTARVLEFVGVDAYIGGATLIEDKGLLVSAAEILAVEARHNTVLNTFNGGSSIPSAFDMVLTPQQVLIVAAPFISGGCDPVAALGLTPTPALTLTNTEPLVPGTLLTFGGAGLEGQDTSGMFCSMITGGVVEGVSFPIGECKVPDGLDGPVHIFIVKSATPLSSNIITQDASAIVAGPIVTFIDTLPNRQADLLKGQGGGGGGFSLDLSPLVASGPGKVVLVTEVTIE